jgi:exodeoxyribonuclease X
MGHVLIFDTEQTDRKEGEIIEAAWIRLEGEVDLAGASDRIPHGLPIADVFRGRYRPQKMTTFGALSVHHILPSDLEGKPPSSSFALPAEVTYLIGHSIDYDWRAAGAPQSVKRICTHALAQHIWPEDDSHSQVALIYMLLGPTPETRELVKGAHGADADVMLNRTLLTHILQAKMEITTWSALWEYSEECRIPIYCPMKRWEGQKLEEMDDSAIGWCLRQEWLDPYLRKGFERVMAERYPPVSFVRTDNELDDTPY